MPLHVPASARLRRRATLAVLAVLCLPLAGCWYIAGGAALGATVGVASAPRRVSTLPGPWQPDAAVAVDFAPAHEALTVAAGTPDSTLARDVTRLVGRVRQVRGDTAFVSVTEIRRLAGGPMGYARGTEPVVRIVHGEGVRVTRLSVAKSPETRGLLGAAVGALLMVIGIFAYCVAEECLT